MGHATDNTFSAVLIEPREIATVEFRLRVIEAGDGGEALAAIENWPAIEGLIIFFEERAESRQVNSQVSVGEGDP